MFPSLDINSSIVQGSGVQACLLFIYKPSYVVGPKHHVSQTADNILGRIPMPQRGPINPHRHQVAK